MRFEQRFIAKYFAREWVPCREAESAFLLSRLFSLAQRYWGVTLIRGVQCDQRGVSSRYLSVSLLLRVFVIRLRRVYDWWFSHLNTLSGEIIRGIEASRRDAKGKIIRQTVSSPLQHKGITLLTVISAVCLPPRAWLLGDWSAPRLWQNATSVLVTIHRVAGPRQ